MILSREQTNSIAPVGKPTILLWREMPLTERSRVILQWEKRPDTVLICDRPDGKASADFAGLFEEAGPLQMQLSADGELLFHSLNTGERSPIHPKLKDFDLYLAVFEVDAPIVMFPLDIA